MYRLIGRIALALILAGALNACAQEKPEAPLAGVPADVNVTQAAASQSAGGPGLQERYPRYRLQRNDVFDLDFALTPEFNQTVTVQPDGFVSLRGIDAIHVASLTVAEATEAIRSRYSSILREPVIALVLKDFEKPYFVASGEFNRPGKYELRDKVTVAQAIAMAGGFTTSAKHSQVLLFRRVSDEWLEVKKLNVKRMLAQADLKEDPVLGPGDMLHVPKSAIGKIKQFIPTIGAGVHYNPNPNRN
ncbi:MAG TPA: polysaccharide biosynthesis/export family protein [Terriglobales bacterium]|jgi:polysaccharide export outer membrane protein|nr:polysaccharide biosynthesis/export family protein [Terriglobales bacterium]